MATLVCGGTHVGVAPMFMRIVSQVMRLYRYREQGPRARKAKNICGLAPPSVRSAGSGCGSPAPKIGTFTAVTPL